MRHVPIAVEYIDRVEYNTIARRVDCRVCETEHSPQQYARIVRPTRVNSGSALYELFRDTLPDVGLFWVPHKLPTNEAKRLLRRYRNSPNYYESLFHDAQVYGRLVVEYSAFEKAYREKDDFTFFSEGEELVLARFRVTKEHFRYYLFDPPLPKGNFKYVLGIREP